MGLLKILRSSAAKKVMLEALLIPAVGTIVGYEAQKALIKRDQKKLLKQQQAQAVETPEVEVIEENNLPK